MNDGRPPTHAPTPHHPTAHHAPPSSRLTNNAHIPESLQRKPVKDEEPLELAELDEVHADVPHNKIHGVSSSGPVGPANRDWARTTHKNQTGAVRVRSFHCRLSEQGLEHIDHAINDWLDRHPDIEVKFTTSTIGHFDGKIKEPALILNVWY